MSKQEDLKSQNVASEVAYDASRGYPANKNLYYECPLCHSWIPSLPDDYAEARCTCGHIEIDIDWGRLSVRDQTRQPILLRLSPRNG